MTEKRFKIINVSSTNIDVETYVIANDDNADDDEVFELYESKERSQELCDMINKLIDENKELKQSYTKLEHRHRLLHDECLDAECDRDSYQKDVSSLEEENEQLKKELHLMHIRTMFSTVQSFKGDVSERYTYSDETDTIYDTANHYGQYNKVLDKKEIVMLLNEYETILKELKE